MEKSLEPMNNQVGADEHERRGTVWSGTAHVVAAVIGSGVLALAWSVAQLGWVLGPLVLVGFAAVTLYTSTLLADCYRFPSPDCGRRNLTYMDAVRSYLGPRQVFMCGVAQYANLWGTMVGYTITAATSMMAIKRADCFHREGHAAKCYASGNKYMVIFGIMEVALSQFPSLEKITWVSAAAAAMSLAYSLIGLGLCGALWRSHGEVRGTVGGVTAAPAAKTWNALQALGNIAFAYTFAEVLIEIQDTLKSPPAENVTMKRVTKNGIGLTSAFYVAVGCVGYAAFGNSAPGNILTGFGFYEPFWLVDLANLCIVIHLIGAYQVFSQPIFAALEKQVSSRWPDAKFATAVCKVPIGRRTLTVAVPKLVLRTALVALTTLVAALLPFFNSVLGLLGASSFWPLSVYFPVSMHIVQANVRRWSPKWALLQGLSLFCLIVSLLATLGSVADISRSLKHAAPFRIDY